MNYGLDHQQAPVPLDPMPPQAPVEAIEHLAAQDHGLAQHHLAGLYDEFHGAWLRYVAARLRQQALLAEQERLIRGDHIDVRRVAKLEENKQARDKHVLGLLTALRAVFPGNVTEQIGREILPSAKYDVVPDELQLKLPTKEKRKVQYEQKKIQFDKKFTSYRKHRVSFQRR